MSLNLQRKNSGMLLLVVIGVIGVAFIIFISMVDRVRQESAVTNRVAINERLYQVSSAIGRLAIKKIQKKFELRDSGFGKEIFDSAGKTGVVMKGSLTSELNGTVSGIDIIDDLIKGFKDEWGDDGKLEFSADYSVELIKDSFDLPFIGFTGEKKNRESKGYIDVTVTATHNKVTKKFTIRKEFYLLRLLPAPFYRFTLFSKSGADLKDEVANNSEVDGTGKIVAGKLPFVCINRMFDKAKKKTFDYSEPAFSATGENNFVKNGWIYMGGQGRYVNSKNEKGLILNIPTGLGDDNLTSKFGEHFHFYFQEKSQGWVVYEPFSNPLQNLGFDSKNEIDFVYVDYGVFRGIDNINFPPESSYNLFKNAFADYDSVFKSRNGITCFNSSNAVWSGNSMRLFGTIKNCTPTIVFGPVRRRYVRTFGLIFTWKGASRVYAIARKSEDSFKKDIYTVAPSTEAEEYVSSEIKIWLNNKYGDYDSAAYDDFGKKFTDNLGKGSFPKHDDMVPQILDYEPYNQALHNLCEPTGTDKSWQEVVGKVDGTYMPSPAKRDELLQTDYKFNNDVNLHYNGSIEALEVSSDYLKDRVTYLIPKEGKSATSLKKCQFFQDTFVEQDDKKNNQLFLNQIVEFEGDLIIDQDLIVQKGGIIICDGNITVNASIKNPYLEKPGAADADNFGWLSLVSRKGNIEFKSNAGKKLDSDATVPQIHGFFIAKKNVVVDSRLHIIGGVATDRMESLVEKGCVIQWGFHPEEISEDKDLSLRDYYGLAIGPRDIEIITED